MYDENSKREVLAFDYGQHFNEALNRRFADIALNAEKKKSEILGKAGANGMTSNCPAVLSAIFEADNDAHTEKIHAYFELASEHRRSDYHEAFGDLTTHVRTFAEAQRQKLCSVRPELDANTRDAMLRRIDGAEIGTMEEVKFKLADRRFHQP